ncbi:MAG: GGDEF domain-containing protein, partial [Oceanospirillum sp.]|nr:GGDEF domain-containing protein [Oceanospirillum sp.]
YNRRYLDITLPRMVFTAQRMGIPLSVLICDIDFFKSFNDTFGHLAGDEVLQQVAKMMKELFEDKALISRFGGEEFVLVFSGLTAEEAYEEAEKLRDMLKKMVLCLSDHKEGLVTISGGICSLSREITTAEKLIQCADKALYQAKNGGRDQVVLASAVVETE